MKDFSVYVAVGDSMSIDYYPAADLGIDPDEPVGASSLLYRNHSEYWPAFEGRDLLSANPNLEFANLTADGATTWDLLDSEFLGHLKPFFARKVLLTITLGGNDMLQMLYRLNNSSPSKVTSETSAIVERYTMVLARLKEHLPNSTFILNTIFDPSDGRGTIPNYPSFADKLPFLHYVNHEISRCAKSEGMLFADVYSHFLGHGLSSPEEGRYFWKTNPIEPSAVGASQLRALWLDALGSSGLLK
jgi:lysophospholipase L1-like esterase